MTDDHTTFAPVPDPTPNVPLLRKAVEWAEAEAARPGGGAWLQSAWTFDVDEFLAARVENPEERLDILARQNVSPTCGTAYCIAGYVAHVDGVIDPHNEARTTTGMWIAEYARRQLGLTHDEAADLFAGSNTIEHVRLLADEIAERAGERL